MVTQPAEKARFLPLSPCPILRGRGSAARSSHPAQPGDAQAAAVTMPRLAVAAGIVVAFRALAAGWRRQTPAAYLFRN